MSLNFFQFAAAVFVGLGAGYIGSFMVLKRMSLVGDALSHVALPGIAIALLLHINPFIGAFVFLLVAVVGIWYIEKDTHLPSETLVGIFFTLSLALGLLLTPEPELLEALFGDISGIGLMDFLFVIILIPLLLAQMKAISREMMLGIISPELASSMGFKTGIINLKFMLMVAVVVALGLKAVGTLLMGSLVIIPAAAARNVSSGMHSYTITSALLGALAGALGIIIAVISGMPPGPSIVLTSGGFFVITYILRRT